MRRRQLLGALAAPLMSAAGSLPANKNVKWALSLALWNHYARTPFTDVLDVMRDTGFIGLRLNGYPGLLQRWDVTPALIEKEMAKRQLRAISASFGGPLHDPAQRTQTLEAAKAVAAFIKSVGGNHLTVFSPARVQPGQNRDIAFKELCERVNQIADAIAPHGVIIGLHNHLDQMVEQVEDIDRFLKHTNPKAVYLTLDTAHLHLAGGNVPATLEKHKDRIRRVIDYKDAKWRKPKKDWIEPSGKVYAADSRQARFLNSINDLGDGEIDFAACHQVLKSISYKGWICVDLDAARQGVRKSYDRCGAYVTSKLEGIYA